MFRHPKYYKELRKLRNKLDQTISNSQATADDSVRSGRASSVKLQASSPKLLKHQATRPSPKQASVKLEATSNKLPDPRTMEKFQAP